MKLQGLLKTFLKEDNSSALCRVSFFIGDKLRSYKFYLSFKGEVVSTFEKKLRKIFFQTKKRVSSQMTKGSEKF